MPRPLRRRSYNQVSSFDDETAATTTVTTATTTVVEDVTSASSGESEAAEGVPPATTTARRRRPADYRSVSSDDDCSSRASDTSKRAEEETVEEPTMTIVILDSAQKRFQVPAHLSWKISTLKERGQQVHKVAPAAQRLIFRGKLLRDTQTLEECGIQDQVIVHLFPKPRLVVVNSSQDDADCSDHGSNASNSSETGSQGAHVPRIVLDATEAQQRSSILVLGSPEIMEAQNNVKLFSFLLLIICSMELMALFTIMLGGGGGTVDVDPNSQDDQGFDPDVYGGGEEVRSWRTTDYFDLIISAVGVHVALLGIKATTENTRRIAKRYMWGTLAVGIAWNIFYYYLNVQAEREIDAERVRNQSSDMPPAMTNSQFYSQALFAIMLPGIIWILCCLRAWQFHHLLEEAELEAEERTRSELDLESNHSDAADPTLTIV